jgi:hypothetical protein
MASTYLAEVLASNLTVNKPFRGAAITVEPMTVKWRPSRKAALIESEGIRLSLTGRTAWKRAEACRALAVITDLAVNLLAGGPWSAMGFTCTVRGSRCPGLVLRDWDFYELVAATSSPHPGPHTMNPSAEVLARVDSVVAGALSGSIRRVEDNLSACAALEMACQGGGPYERLRHIWVGFESLVAPSGDLLRKAQDWLDGAEAALPGFIRALALSERRVLTDLLRRRGRMLHEGHHSPGVQAALSRPLASERDRVISAIGMVYAVRNRLFHGAWSHLDRSRVVEARAGARLTWRLVELEVTHRFTGHYSKPVTDWGSFSVTI